MLSEILIFIPVVMSIACAVYVAVRHYQIKTRNKEEDSIKNLIGKDIIHPQDLKRVLELLLNEQGNGDKEQERKISIIKNYASRYGWKI